MVDSADELLRDEPLGSATNHLTVVPPDEHERNESWRSKDQVSHILVNEASKVPLTENIAASDGAPQPVVPHGRDSEHRQARPGVGRNVPKVVDDVDRLEIARGEHQIPWTKNGVRRATDHQTSDRHSRHEEEQRPKQPQEPQEHDRV